MNRARSWLLIWFVASLVAGLFYKITETIYSLENNVVLQYPPYTDIQVFLVLFFLPLCLIPALCASCYYAVKENRKRIKLLTIVLITHHLLCWIAFLITHLFS